MKHFVLLRPDPKFNEIQLKHCYYFLGLVSCDRILMELVLSSFFFLKSYQLLSEVSGNLDDHGQWLLPPASKVWWDQQKGFLISVALPLLERANILKMFNFSPSLFHHSFPSFTDFIRDNKECWDQMNSSDLDDLPNVLSQMKIKIAHLFLARASHDPIAALICFKELCFVPTHCNNQYFYFSCYLLYFRC